MFWVFVSVIDLLVVGFIAFRLIKPLTINKLTKIILLLCLILIPQKLALSGLLSVFGAFNPLSLWFVLGTGIAQVALFVLLGWTVVCDIVWLIFRLFGKKPKGRILCTVLLTFFMTTYGIWQALKLPQILPVTIVSDKLPENWRPITIAVLSDLHISTDSAIEKDWLRQVVAQTNALNADMIAVVGDMIDAPLPYLENQISPLLDLHAKDGVYFSFGNHEEYNGQHQWQEFFDSKVTGLVNDKIMPIQVGGNEITLVGIFKRSELVDTLPAKSPLFVLSHRPSLTHLPNTKAVLQISGHTHGGQFGFVLQPLVARANRGFVRGLYDLDGSFLYVTAGSGLWRGFPFRFMTPAEITLITVKKIEKD